MIELQNKFHFHEMTVDKAYLSGKNGGPWAEPPENPPSFLQNPSEGGGGFIG